MPLIAFLAPIFLFIPGSTAFFARSTGRSFWGWFALGTFFPVVSFAVLWFLSEKRVAD